MPSVKHCIPYNNNNIYIDTKQRIYIHNQCKKTNVQPMICKANILLDQWYSLDIRYFLLVTYSLLISAATDLDALKMNITQAKTQIAIG